MTDRFSYENLYGAPYPFWLSPPSPYPPASAPPFLISNPVESYDPTQGVFDPMISQGIYQRSLADWPNNPSYRENSLSQTPSSSFYAENNRPGNCGPRGENMLSPHGLYSSGESSSDFVPYPAEMLIKNNQEPFYTPVASSGVYASSNSLDENRPGYYFPGSGRPGIMNVVPGSYGGEPYKDSNPSLPISKTQALFDGRQTGIHIGDGISISRISDVRSHAPEDLVGVQSSLHNSSIEPVNFDALIGYGEAADHIKPFKNPVSDFRIVGSQGSRSPQSSYPIPSHISSSISLIKDIEGSVASSLNQRPYNLVADSKNGASENSMKNAVEDLNCDEHIFWNHVMASSRGAVKEDKENAKSAVKYKPPFEGSTFQPSEDNQANPKPCKQQEQMLGMYGDKKTTLLTDIGVNGSIRSNGDDVSTDRSPERVLCDQGEFPSSSSPRVSSVINTMHNLSEVLVYECFNNGSWLKLDQLECLDKVVDNLTKCLKKITGNRTVSGEASVPTQAMHVSSPNVFNLNEPPKVDFQGFNVKPLDSYDMKEPVDENEMTQGIKNVLASNFLDGEENHPQTLLYKNLWLETEAALCSTTCMARYHRIKNEIDNPKLHDRETSADASTSMQDPSLNPQKSVPIMNNAEQETTESLIKHSSNHGNNVVTMSTDAPQSSRVNSDSVDAVLSLMYKSLKGGLEQTIHGNLSPDAATSENIPDAVQQESPDSTKKEKHNDVIYRFQILKQQRETNGILETQNNPETNIGDQEENQEALKIADIGRSSHVSDVMDRFQILKRREAEQVEKSLKGLDIDSENDQPSSETQMRDHLWSGSLIKIRGNSQIETCADAEPSVSGKGCESPTSDWEHVLKDN